MAERPRKRRKYTIEGDDDPRTAPVMAFLARAQVHHMVFYGRVRITHRREIWDVGTLRHPVAMHVHAWGMYGMYSNGRFTVSDEGYPMHRLWEIRGLPDIWGIQSVRGSVIETFHGTIDLTDAVNDFRSTCPSVKRTRRQCLLKCLPYDLYDIVESYALAVEPFGMDETWRLCQCICSSE